mgnify:CR=1 FL=1
MAPSGENPRGTADHIVGRQSAELHGGRRRQKARIGSVEALLVGEDHQGIGFDKVRHQRARYEEPGLHRALGGEPRYGGANDRPQVKRHEALRMLRRRGGLAGHAEMEGKTLFLKFNTGPSGHGMPPSAGEAAALYASQETASNLVLARRLHDYELPAGWMVGAAANPLGSGYEVAALDPALDAALPFVRTYARAPVEITVTVAL